jgi:DinB family protein
VVSQIIDPASALAARVDPVAQAKEYQDMLTGLVGDRDPDEIQTGQPDQLASLMLDAGPDLRTRPEAREWSVLECAGHMVDAEIVVSGRYRWTVAHDEPPMVPYDQDLWVDRLRHQKDDPEEVLSLFRALRRANLDLWRRSPAEDRSRVAVHAERGPESYELTFRMLAGHGIFHLAQGRQALEGVRGSSG